LLPGCRAVSSEDFKEGGLRLNDSDAISTEVCQFTEKARDGFGAVRATRFGVSRYRELLRQEREVRV
jgi:urease gamma subunit